MNGPDMNKPSETNWALIDAQTDETIDRSELPHLDESFFARATLRMPRQQEKITFGSNIDQHLLHPKLVILVHRPERCPRCLSALDDVVIDVTWNDWHFLVIEDVPALRCRDQGHEYILEEILERIKRLSSLEKAQKLQPTEIMQVPVFSLKMAA